MEIPLTAPQPDNLQQVQESTERIKNEMPRMHPNSAINSKYMKGSQKTQRQANRTSNRLMDDFDTACTRHINIFFKFMEGKPDNEAVKAEIVRIDGLWKAWLKTQSEKYHYNNCRDFFATKISFLIGERKFNEDLVQQLQGNV